MDASSSSSRSSSPASRVEVTRNPPTKRSNAIKTASGKNEGVDPNWAYKPPPGVIPLELEDEDIGEFNWNAVEDEEDNEIWLIRLPEGIKPKYLQNLKLEIPQSQASETLTIGTLSRKLNSFDVWSVAQDTESTQQVSAEEMKGLTCILPRKGKKGKMYPASKPIARHVVLTAQPPLPTPAPPLADAGDRVLIAGTEDTPEVTGPPYKNPERQSYPLEVLKHRFMPYGSLVVSDADATLNNDADITMEPPEGEGMGEEHVDDGNKVPEEIDSKKTKRRKNNEMEKMPVVEIVKKRGMDGDKGASGKKRKGQEAVSASVKKSKKSKTGS